MRNDCITSETVKLGRRTYTINLYHDQDTESPLENDYGVFITCNKGSRSQYGNEPLSEEEHERIGERIEEFYKPESVKARQLARAMADEEYVKPDPSDGPLIGLPVYVYEHGNVAISTSPFTCSWDSGQSGFIYITPKTALEWQGGKRLTKSKVANVLKSLEAVVEEYSMWCNGECYYYTIDDENGIDIGESCGGFIGDEYCISEAKSAAEHYHKERVKDACAKRIAVAKERIERLMWAARGVVTC